MRSIKGRAAAVAAIGAALDQAVVAQPVHQPRQRDRLDIERLRQIGLLEAFMPLQPQQHRPLRPGHAETARLLVGVGPQQAADVADQEQKLAVSAAVGHRHQSNMLR
jgi:hypothetical protein